MSTNVLEEPFASIFKAECAGSRFLWTVGTRVPNHIVSHIPEESTFNIHYNKNLNSDIVCISQFFY
jgi:hypothetical protein